MGAPVVAAATSPVPAAGSGKAAGYSDDVVAGAVAGAVARLISAPFDVLKIRFQLQFDKVKYTSMVQAFATVTKEEGFLSLWKGNLSATYLWITYSMVQFSVYGWLKTVGLQAASRAASSPSVGAGGSSSSGSSSGSRSRSGSSDGGVSGLWKTVVLFLAGAGAGLVATSTTYPFDIMRTQFAVQGSSRVFPTMHSFIKNTLETKGFRGFYVGLSPALVGITPYMGLNFALFESFSALAARAETSWREARRARALPTTNSNSNSNSRSNSGGLLALSRNAVCGGMAGGLSKLVVYPLDTIKKRLQVQVLTNPLDGAASMPRYSGVADLVRKTLKSEGLAGFYKGIGPTTAKAVVSTAVTFAAFESTKDFLQQRRRQQQQQQESRLQK